MLALEPGARAYLLEEQLETACEAMADFADIKSPYLLGHSPGVAALAAGAARRCGLPDDDVMADPAGRPGCTMSGGSVSRPASGASPAR